MQLLSVIRIISILMIVLIIFMIFPAGIALFYGEYNVAIAFLKTIIVIGVISVFFLKMLPGKEKQNLRVKDGFLFVTLSWIVASLIGAFPFYLSGEINSFTDAFFETASGFTTTGASILSEIETMSKSALFWRALTHWLGGMGIVVLTVAILPILGIGGLQLVKAEAPGPTVDKLSPRIAETAKILWMIYVGLTLAQTALLMFGGLSFFDAITHAFATMATGGFSTKNASVMGFQSAYVEIVITIFMFLAGINFAIHFRFLTGKFRFVFKDSELRAYVVIFVVTSLLIASNLYKNYYPTIYESLRHAFFQAATIITTTGFASADYEKWPYFSQVVLFILMFVGGCTGSTGGGVKVLRVITLLKQGLNEMKYLLHPRGVFILKISGNTIKKDIVYAISGFFFLYIFTILTVTLIVSFSGHDIITSLTTALATVGNIGPGFGKVGPTENYAFYSDFIKWVLSFAMIAGRLEIYTFLVIFFPYFWKR
ncbi:MAG: transport (Trk) system, rane component [Deferribacteraceae bacterium]|nr:transport (Trk) system, rane component [Deferribacteraceae bacterium]